MKNFRVNVDGVDYEVEVEDLGGETTESSNVKKPNNKKQTATRKPKKSKKSKKTVRKESAKPTVDSQDSVVAQMPGTILEIMVSEGDKVENGQDLLVLEAMKMENMIKASKAGTVKEINVSENDSVDTGDQLAHIE
ncbi:Biotin-requiring enzyme [Halanaerobium congolense]|jgi:biotin carboxyl carrier protein|uniref:Biotin-requiring enzyme n=1 Tax=Halanaerobium congolense TaxID=54121 RepID=A0A1G8IVL9_9FIRM|nr:biotin/lipoyl-containing protein [Halanaerobium congolense]SDI23095.1 Biotin-requiring enzyme [Halanaerobium congolense]SES66388.1 Biotin-requiring enzyme [Halanaerobium congolense]